MKLSIKIRPNSSRQEIQKDLDGTITKIFLKKPATDGKANRELEKLLTKYFKKPVKIIHGHTSKNKIIQIM